MPLLLRQLSEHAVVNKFGRSLPRQHASARPGSRSPGTTACSAQAFSRSPAGDFVYREHDGIEASWQLLDWTKLTIDETPHRWSALLEDDAAQPFDFAKPPLVRFLAIELPQGRCHLLMTYPKVLLDEDAVFRLLCAWLGALEGALPLDAEEPSRPFEESPTIVGWWSERLAEPRMLQVDARRTLDWPTGARAESHLTMDREMSAAFENLCFGVRDAFLAFCSLVIGRLTDRDNLTLLASCPVTGPRNLGWGLIENVLPALVSIRNERTARNG